MNGAKLKEIREPLDLLQDEIALHLGVNNETVCRWERGNVELRKVYSDAVERLSSDPEAVKRLQDGRVARKMERRQARLRRSSR